MEFPALINIGLASPNGNVRVSTILNTLKEWNVELHSYRVQLGGEQDENTFIAHVEDWSDGKAWIVADSLHQDCIAQYNLSACEGRLIGPHAVEWGEFQAQLFKLL